MCNYVSCADCGTDLENDKAYGFLGDTSIVVKPCPKCRAKHWDKRAVDVALILSAISGNKDMLYLAVKWNDEQEIKKRLNWLLFWQSKLNS